jgi:hypothetical protein
MSTRLQYFRCLSRLKRVTCISPYLLQIRLLRTWLDAGIC